MNSANGFLKVKLCDRHGCMSMKLSFVTDKMPVNFRWLGFILSGLPNAKVVHVSRNPAAVCWSNFKTYFTSRGLGFTYDLDDIV